jgi:hypothetical protein
MENRDTLNEPFRESLHGTLDETKWKRIAYIFFAISVVILAAAAIFIFLYIDKEEEENEEKKEDNKINEWKWEPQGDRIKTRWAKGLDINKIWQEYPRPQLERKDWINLNGPWKYSIRTADQLSPNPFDGYILVPFPVESSLSGVMKTFTKDDILWYEKEVEIPESWKGKHILINFGAVDWKCEVFINRNKVGQHTGGYSYFYFDITGFLKEGKNTILLKVVDVSDTVYSTWGKYQPVGKQTITPNGIWYTPASGVWQTVWLEPVNEYYIEKLEINNNYDSREIKVTFKVANNVKLPIEFKVKFNDVLVGETKGKSNEEISIKLSNENFKPWSPAEPNLYTITADLLLDSGEIVDSITSYTTIRKIESKRDSKTGKLRIYLNNNPLFNIGPLDQGYWPDGIYTAPSDEAMVYDIQKLKELGYNTIRKHVKTEPFRYYYYCDKIGMVLWQDMPSGNVDGSGSWDSSTMNGGTDTVRTQESKDNYYREWGEIIDNLKFFQCIITWTPFNEAWGQFDTEAVVNFTLSKDNLRLINAASGGNHRPVGNFLDLHSYPGPNHFLKYDDLINVIGEYGGLGLEIKNHTWKDDNWGYQVLNDKIELTNRYIEFIENLYNLIEGGISAAIYTQTTDVEGEINGLMTYDRNETKIFDVIKEYHQKLIDKLSELK